MGIASDQVSGRSLKHEMASPNTFINYRLTVNY